MLIIIHGDDIVSSRNFLIDQKSKFPASAVFDGEKVSLTEVIQEVEGGGLFEDKRLLVIENLLSSKKSLLQESIIEFLAKQSDAHVILWEGKEIPAKLLSYFKKSEVKHFKLPNSIFQFVDTLKPSHAARNIQLFHECLKTLESEFIFFMILRQFRLLLGLLEESQDSIDEVKRLAPWQISKLKKQASYFTTEMLITAYKKLYKTDLAIKTGTSPYPLTPSIDFFLSQL